MSASDDDTVCCWDTRTGSLRDVLAGHTSGVTGAALTRVGTRPVAVTVSKDRTVRTWDTTREEPPHVPDGHPGGSGPWPCTASRDACARSPPAVTTGYASSTRATVSSSRPSKRHATSR
ncbi:hypothetical protein KEF29_01135 [Streptomyces tuirus]|uniref:Uncharacterized protein n=1 Tax=Streptomyces tuirus TaxID=68278 RepID=A0A941FE54_9ACTN|nr:hypothetical protein [Streptomyces tuirus]